VNLYTEGAVSGAVTSSNTVAVNMFTGYSLPASTLTVGHRLVITGCWKHTGSTSSSYALVFGSSSTAVQSASTGTGVICLQETIMATGTATETQYQFTSNTPAGATVFAAQQNFLTQTLNSGSLAINFTQAASGTGDSYTGYSLTVDLL
jgi:uncharacterized protein YraI